MKALDGVRILDLSRVLAGPWATQMLGDLGAEVIKVEKPGAGDDTRGWGPPWHGEGESREAAYFLAANRNKKSLAIDIAKPEGQALVRRLAEKSDVLVENFKAGGLQRYGLDYQSLREINPRLIYCSITGFGQTGPRAAEAGYDLMIQAMSGFMSITGEPDGEPQRAGVAIIDVMTGLHAAVAILAALRQRDATGEGQAIDLALFDVAMSCLANQASNYLVSGKAPMRQGNTHPNIVPYQLFATADGLMILAVGNDAQFARFAGIAGHGEWAADPRFASNAARVGHRETLVPMIAEAMRRRTTGDWIAALNQAGIPCGPVNDIAAALADPQAAQRGLVQHLPDGLGNTAPSVASPLRLSASSRDDDRAPPHLGQHSAAVLADILGLEAEEIEALHKDRVI